MLSNSFKTLTHKDKFKYKYLSTFSKWTPKCNT